MEKLWIIDCETTGIFRTSSLLEFGGLVLNIPDRKSVV